MTTLNVNEDLQRYPAEAPTPAPGDLVWSDEFDYAGLPDPSKWTFEEGFVRNRETQYYTDRRTQNARVEDGMLVIEAHRERFPNRFYESGSSDWRRAPRAGEYTSACMTTFGKAAWKYGYIEARAKFPRGAGMWPAIWTLGANVRERSVGWPRCGEIDIVEYVASDPDVVHATLHFAEDGEHRSIGKKRTIEHPYDQFHVYAVDWTRRHINFYCDGLLYHSIKAHEYDKCGHGGFDTPHFLLVNLAMGGDWAGRVDPENFPCRMLLDYVRVYQSREHR